jgi:two-component system, cell cycle response regulator
MIVRRVERSGALLVAEPPDEFEDSESTAIFTLDALEVASKPGDARHVLVRMDGSDIGKVIALKPAHAFTVGRLAECDLSLKYEGVSRHHARIVFENGSYVVEDLGSANGTLIRGQRVRRHALKDGDVLQFGPLVSVRYSITDSQEEHILRHLYEASVRDSLTGAFNREYLSERLKSEVAFAQRHRTDASLIMFDLDHFKRVNDTFGHPAGDAVLIEVVRTVNKDLRTEDILARYGGEEFAITLRGVNLAGTERLAERIRANNARSVKVGTHEIPVSISVGCAMLSECGDPPSVEKLVATADRRLYAAKTGGRNRVVAVG